MTNLSIKLYGFITGLLHREEGQDLIEYALLGGLIAAAIVAVAVLVAFTSGLTGMAEGIRDCIDFDATSDCTGPFV